MGNAALASSNQVVMEAESCILCGAPPPLTAEHIWPDWYNRQQPNLRYELESEIDGGETKRRKTQALNLKPRVLCLANKCNGTWGSRLKENVKPILTPMISGAKRDLASPEAHLLSGWFFLKSMVAEYLVTRTEGPFFRLKDGLRLRTTLQPPDWCRIWMGRYVGERRNAGWIMDRTSARQVSKDPPAAVGWYSTTYSIGQACFQSITLTRPVPLGEVEEGQDVTIRFDWAPGDWSSGLIPIWPRPSVNLPWPPEKAFDDNGFQHLADRWSHQTGYMDPVG